MIFHVFRYSSRIATYDIPHSTYSKVFDSKIKSLMNAYTTDIHINKQQTGRLTVKFIITATNLSKLHKMYSYQVNPKYRICFDDPETGFSYNIHWVSNFQQNRLAFKDIVDYFLFDAVAEIIGTAEFPRYSTGNSSYYTHWSEYWDAPPVANQPAFKTHPYYASKFDLTGLSTLWSATLNDTKITESDDWAGHGDGYLRYFRKSSWTNGWIKYDLSSYPSFDNLSILLNDCFVDNSDGYFRLKYWLSTSANIGGIVDLYWWRAASQMLIRWWPYDGATGSTALFESRKLSSFGLNSPKYFGIRHDKKNGIININLGDFPEGTTRSNKPGWPEDETVDPWSYDCSSFAQHAPAYLEFGFKAAINVIIAAKHGALEFAPDHTRKIII